MYCGKRCQSRGLKKLSTVGSHSGSFLQVFHDDWGEGAAHRFSIRGRYCCPFATTTTFLFWRRVCAVKAIATAENNELCPRLDASVLLNPIQLEGNAVIVAGQLRFNPVVHQVGGQPSSNSTWMAHCLSSLGKSVLLSPRPMASRSESGRPLQGSIAIVYGSLGLSGPRPP